MAGLAQLKWNGDKLKDLTTRQMEAGLDAAGWELHRIARQKASIQNTPVVVPITRPRRGGNATQRTTYPHPSKPGESPRIRTGVGHANIVAGRRGQIFRVGYTRVARYMTFHELGIRYKHGMQQRPTIVPALRDNAERLSELFERAARAAKK